MDTPARAELAAAHKRWRNAMDVTRVLRLLTSEPRAEQWGDVLTVLADVQPVRARVGLLHSLDLERVVVLARSKPVLGLVEQRNAPLIREHHGPPRTFASGLRLCRVVALSITRRVGGIVGSRWSSVLVPDSIPLAWTP